MKIICTKSEFAMLVRSCAYALQMEDCKNCWFSGICSENNAISDGEIMSCIEDVCEIESGG